MIHGSRPLPTTNSKGEANDRRNSQRDLRGSLSCSVEGVEEIPENHSIVVAAAATDLSMDYRSILITVMKTTRMAATRQRIERIEKSLSA